MADKNITINVGFGTVAKTIFFILLLWVLYQLLDLVLIVLTAVVIATAIEPATRRLVKLRIPRVLAVIILYFVVFGIFSGVIIYLIPTLTQELGSLSKQLPDYINSLNLLDSPIAETLGEGALPSQLPFSEAINSLSEKVADISGNFLSVLSTVFGGALSLLLIVVMSFYLSVQEKGIENFLGIITPVKYERYVIDLWHRSQKKIGLWLRGQLLLALIVGVLVYLGLTIFGIKYALLLAIIAAIFELIPIFGPILSAIPAIAIAFIGPDGGLDKAFIVVILYVIIQQFENQLLYPLVVKQVVGVPSIVAIIALIAGGTLAGLLGMILSVPLAAVLMELFNDLDKEKHHLRAKGIPSG